MTVRRRDESVPNRALYNLRDAHGWSQRELAAAVNDLAAERGETTTVETNTVSRWERGVVTRPSSLHRRLLAEVLGVSLADLGFTAPYVQSDGVPGEPGHLNVGGTVALDSRVERSQQDWRSTRHELGGARSRLAREVARLYPEDRRLGRSGLLTHPDWLLSLPRPLTDIHLEFDPAPDPPMLTGTEAASAQTRPLATTEHRYHRYTQAIRDIEPPRLFENRVGWRLLDLAWTPAAMRFGHTTYFEMIDMAEGLAHEAAQACLRGGEVLAPAWRRLPLRSAVGDPFDLHQRVVLPSIDTLTIRSGPEGASIVLHRRDSTRVAIAGGTLHIMPAGVFQPSSILPTTAAADFDLWANVQREFSEEFLGNPEHAGDGAPIDYDHAEPFRSMELARAAGHLRIWVLGVAIDALTLAAEILTVAVISDDVYDDIFKAAVDENDEGTIATFGQNRVTRVPFDKIVLDDLLADPLLAPAAAGCIDLAWRHRELLLRTVR